MASLLLYSVALSTALSWVLLGGGLYEYTAIDPFWPRQPQLIQPARGGISRKRFWIPTHTVFELLLIASLAMAWSLPAVRGALLVAFVSHAIMRIWSAFDFIPRALAFERADPASVSVDAARRWTRRSLLRLPLDLVTCGAMLVAIIQVGRLA